MSLEITSLPSHNRRIISMSQEPPPPTSCDPPSPGHPPHTRGPLPSTAAEIFIVAESRHASTATAITSPLGSCTSSFHARFTPASFPSAIHPPLKTRLLPTGMYAIAELTHSTPFYLHLFPSLPAAPDPTLHTPPYPIPSHPTLHHSIPSDPIPPFTIPSGPIRSYPAPMPCHPISSRPIPPPGRRPC